MKLILLRHALQNADSEQALSVEGKEALRKTIFLLKNEQLCPKHVYASPVRRAKETGEMVSSFFHAPLEEEEALHYFDPEKLFEILQNSHEDTIVFVGHAPSINEFAETLLLEPTQDIERACALVLDVEGVGDGEIKSKILAYITPGGIEK